MPVLPAEVISFRFPFAPALPKPSPVRAAAPDMHILAAGEKPVRSRAAFLTIPSLSEQPPFSPESHWPIRCQENTGHNLLWKRLRHFFTNLRPFNFFDPIIPFIQRYL